MGIVLIGTGFVFGLTIGVIANAQIKELWNKVVSKIKK